MPLNSDAAAIIAGNDEYTLLDHPVGGGSATKFVGVIF
jgi:hypothetical protein